MIGRMANGKFPTGLKRFMKCLNTDFLSVEMDHFWDGGLFIRLDVR